VTGQQGMHTPAGHLILPAAFLDIRVCPSPQSLSDLCFLKDLYSVRIRVRIDPPHPLECHKRGLNGAVLRMKPEKPRSRVTVGVAR
jgi:hypothetical protein